MPMVPQEVPVAREVMEQMSAGGFRHMPVIENKRMIGVISIGDAVKETISQQQSIITQLENYIKRIGPKRMLDERIDFGIISPYKAQVQYLRNEIKRSRFLRPFKAAITVHTVDGFQGQERDVIFISLVRANDDGQIGFLSDLRRMNVAITRARMKLVILGDASTLTKHKFYRELFEYIKLL
mgnify:CR=1 FL=1